jgi:hypothetical protein
MFVDAHNALQQSRLRRSGCHGGGRCGGNFLRSIGQGCAGDGRGAENRRARIVGRIVGGR